MCGHSFLKLSFIAKQTRTQDKPGQDKTRQETTRQNQTRQDTTWRSRLPPPLTVCQASPGLSQHWRATSPWQRITRFAFQYYSSNMDPRYLVFSPTREASSRSDLRGSYFRDINCCRSAARVRPAKFPEPGSRVPAWVL